MKTLSLSGFFTVNLRITQNRQVDLGRLQANNHLSAAAVLREQISSGIRVSKPSDDPRAQELILDQKAVISQLETRSEVIDEVRFVLNEAHNQIRSAQNLVVKAKDIALQANQITDPVEAEAFALEVEGLLKAMENIANTRHAGRYLFGGTDLQSPPYGDISEATNYQGNRQSGTTFVAGAGEIRTFYAGVDVFTSGQGGQTDVRGTTGIVGGTGTASGHGGGQLLVTHSSTTYSGVTGIQPGLSSGLGDTVLGPTGTHQIQIVDTSGTGASGTISLNGGTPVNFTSADDDLLVTGPDGERIFVDTRSIAAGTNSTVDLTANGRISLNGGATSIPIDFSANQLLQDEGGNYRYFDTRNAVSTGTDEVQLTGNTDLFHQLRNLRDDLREMDSFSGHEWTERVSRHIGALEQSGDHLLRVVGEQSVDLQQLDIQQSRSQDIQFEAEKILNGLEATDLTSAVLELQEKELQHQFTLATLARAYDSSILDYL